MSFSLVPITRQGLTLSSYAPDYSGFDSVFNVKAYGAKGDSTTDDTIAINNAISDFNAAGGGVLYFPHGKSNFYKTSGGHILNAPGTVCGTGGPQAHSGFGSSALKLADGANTSMFTLNVQGITVRDLSLYGNQANQTGTSCGLMTGTTNVANYFKLSRLWIADFLTDGILVQMPSGSGSVGGSIVDCEARLCGRYGLNLASGSDCTVSMSLFDQCGANGIYVGTSATFTGVHCWGNGTDVNAADLSGVFINGGQTRWTNCYFETNKGFGAYCKGNNNLFVGCDFWKNFHAGLYAFSNSWTTITGSTFRDNGFSGFTDENGAGLRLDTCTACTVTGNSFFDSAAAGFKHQTYGYAEAADTCAGCVFTGNISRATDHKEGNWLVGAGATPTIPATLSASNSA